MMQHLILAFVWILFCALHSVLASGWLKRKLQPRMGKSFRLYRLYYTVFAFITFIATLLYQFSIASSLLFKRTAVSLITGGAVSVAGISIMLICIYKYFAHLSGLKTLVKEDAVANELMITGIHRYVRHPLYLGTFLFIWGLFILLPYPSLLIANSIITVYTLMAIKWEEAKLEAEFGNSYCQYRQKVPKLIPFFK